MENELPKLDTRQSLDIYKQLLTLVRMKCDGWEPGGTDETIPGWDQYFDGSDQGLVMMKLFSKLSEMVIAESNRIPEKHKAAFFDFIGLEQMAAKAARVPLRFYLTPGAPDGYVPAGTQVAHKDDASIMFETLTPLSVISQKMDKAFSINPWEDKYSEIDDLESPEHNEIYIWSNDPLEKKIEHMLYLGDDTLFNMDEPLTLTVKFGLGAANWPAGITMPDDKERLLPFFSKWTNADGSELVTVDATTVANSTATEMIYTLNLTGIPEKDVVNGIESHWLRISPDMHVSITSQDVEVLYCEIKDPVPDEEIFKTDPPRRPHAHEFPESQPLIEYIKASFSKSDILGKKAFMNSSSLDVEQGFYLFGGRPETKNTFYVENTEVFSKTDATITMKFDLDILLQEDSVDNYNPTAVVNYQYWNGGEWKSLDPVTDLLDDQTIRDTGGSPLITAPFTKPGSQEVSTVTFKCPKWEKTKVANKEGLWLRIQLDSGSYIKPASQQVSVEGGQITTFLMIPEEHRIPYVKSLKFDYSFTDKELDYVVGYDDFKYDFKRKIAPSGVPEINQVNYKPYTPSEEGKPGFYLGFDGNISGQPINVLFALKERLFGEDYKFVDFFDSSVTGEVPYEIVPKVVWEYYAGLDVNGEDIWKPVVIEDGTERFQVSGIVSFQCPVDIQPRRRFGHDRYWVRVRVSQETDKSFVCPEFIGIYYNTAWARNHVTTKNEVIGSGTGSPTQVAKMTMKPVLDGQQIVVVEPEPPSAEEVAVIEEEEGDDAVKIIHDEAGSVKEAAIRWHEVEDFSLSNSSDRHYRIDRINGLVYFGDGTRGMKPPKQLNNIVAGFYHSGGGVKGNSDIGTITAMRNSLAHIKTVSNPMPAFGGADAETEAAALQRGPYALKNRNRAVTSQDFEFLAREASTEVAKALCYRDDASEQIRLIIVPFKDRKHKYTLLPTHSLINEVRDYILARSFVGIKNDIYFYEPVYWIINLEVQYTILDADYRFETDRNISQKIEAFFHTVTGGEKSEGWEFGASIYLSQISALVEKIDNVDFVDSITNLQAVVLDEAGNETVVASTVDNKLQLNPYILPAPGTINVTESGTII